MQSEAATVADYVEEAPEERRAVLNRLRSLCQEILIGYEESMRYKLPCYSKDDAAEVGFASQKNYIALYILKEDVVNANRELLAGLNVGKGCIRYSKPQKMDFDVIEKLLRETYLSTSKPC